MVSLRSPFCAGAGTYLATNSHSLQREGGIAPNLLRIETPKTPYPEIRGCCSVSLAAAANTGPHREQCDRFFSDFWLQGIRFARLIAEKIAVC